MELLEGCPICDQECRTVRFDQAPVPQFVQCPRHRFARDPNVFGNLLMTQRQLESVPIPGSPFLEGPIQQESGCSFECGCAQANRTQTFAGSLVFPAQMKGHALENGRVLVKKLLKILAGNERNLAGS